MEAYQLPDHQGEHHMGIYRYALALTFFSATPLSAAGTAHSPAPQPPSYCTAPGIVLGSGPEKVIADVQAKCLQGDILQLPGEMTYAMAKLCDFGRTIVSGETVACVYAGVHPDR
jgi:hypothetical protein